MSEAFGEILCLLTRVMAEEKLNRLQTWMARMIERKNTNKLGKLLIIATEI